MEALEIQGTTDTPEIILDKEKSIFSFSGKSMPEDVEEFYQPVIQWIENYAASPNTFTKVIFKMKYFNTASSKMLLDVMEHFADANENGNSVEMEWHYPEIDEDMLEAGEGYDELVEVPFKFIAY